ncbi:MAG: hypothetical protein LAT84_13205 [Balneolia bacterium]|nr:hypothetical protein [Balneolia bacterium]
MRVSLKITAIYLTTGFLWILLSDHALIYLAGEELSRVSTFQTAKGLFFVSVTGFLLYLLVEYYMKSINKKIQELRRVNVALDEKAEKLMKANKELEQFAYVTSHDLQEPLRMISSFLTQLERKYSNQLDDKAITYISFAVEGANRMKKIIEDIFDFYDADTETTQSFTDVDLNEVFQNCLLEHQRQIKDLNAEINAGNLPVIRTSQNMMHYLLNVFIDNSLLFSKNEVAPRIEVNCMDEGDFWRFEIQDNGIGIEPEYQKQIFTIFKRLHSKDEYPGTGIGLALAGKIIRKHGGTLKVESDGSSGSKFSFTLMKEPFPK